MKSTIFLLLTLCAAFTQAFDPISLAIEALGIVHLAYSYYNDGKTEFFGDDTQKLILEKHEELTKMIRTYSTQLTETRQEHDQLREAGSIMDSLMDSFRVFDSKMKETVGMRIEDYTLDDKRIFSENRVITLTEKLGLLKTILVPETALDDHLPSLLAIIANQKQADRKQLCGNYVSPRNRTVNVFKKILVLEIKALAVAESVYSKLSSITRDNYSASLQSFRREVEQRLNVYETEMEKVIKTVSNEIKACDPVNAANPAGKWKDGSFFYMKLLEPTHRFERPDQLNFLSLQPVRSDIYFNKVITGIRFVRVNGMVYPQIKQGKLKPNMTVSDEAWKEVDEMLSNDITHSLNWENDRSLQNYEKNTAFLQHFLCPFCTFNISDIAQASLLLQGVNLKFLRDSDYVNDFEVDDNEKIFNRKRDLMSDDHYFDYFEPLVDKSKRRLEYGIDFVGFYPKTQMLMDSIQFPPGHVVTGVGFRFTRTREFYPRWYLTLVAEAIDLKQNQTNLIQVLSQSSRLKVRVSKQATINSTKEAIRFGCDREDFLKYFVGWPIPLDPRAETNPNYEDVKDNEIIQFDHNKVHNFEAGRFMTYFDGVPVEAGRPIGGIGVFHKGTKCSGGFVSFRLHDAQTKEYYFKPI